LEEFDRKSDDLYSFREKIRKTPSELLERDLAELLNDIQFLEAQVDCDIGSYSMKELEKAKEKIAKLKQKADIIKFELQNS